MSDESSTWEQDPFAAAYPETATFWRAAAEGKLMLASCEAAVRHIGIRDLSVHIVAAGIWSGSKQVAAAECTRSVQRAGRRPTTRWLTSLWTRGLPS